jgi:HlyD family secretion protein
MKKNLLPVFLLIVLLNACTQNNDSLVESTGTIEATQIDIRAEVGGRILELYFDEGDRIKPADIFARLDHEKLGYELQQAEARVRELKAKLALLQKGFRDAEVERAKEFLLESEVQLKEQRREFERIKTLFDKEVVSVDVRDRAETAYESALKRYGMAKKDYQIYQEGYRKEEIASAKAANESAEAAVRLIQRNIQDATVVIPCDGVINERYVEPGEFVAPGTLLATVINLQDMWIMAYVSEKNLGKVRLGQTGKVFVDSYPDREFPGKVTYISPEAEFTPKNIQTREERVKLVYGVKVQIDNTEEILKPGMPADVTIEVNNNP